MRNRAVFLGALSAALLATTALHAIPVYNDASATGAEQIAALRDELASLQAQSETIQAKADAENRTLTTEENAEINSIFDRFEVVRENIGRREMIAANRAALNEPMPRLTDPNDALSPEDLDATPPVVPRIVPANSARRPVSVPPRVRDAADHNRHGFNSFGEFAQKVHDASRKGNAHVDQRLQIFNAPSTYGTEGVGADGGFAVPPDFRTAIMAKVQAEESLLGRTDQLVSSSNSITIPKDETTAWQTTGGIQAAWENEAGQLNQSKPSLEESTIKLNKLTALVVVTEELLSDAPSLSSYVNRKAPEKFAFKINDAIVNGVGAGQPLGLLNAPSLVTVNKDSGQAADTVKFTNIVNMWSRLYSGCRQNAVWLINQDIEPQLLGMSFPGSGTAVPVYLPAGGLSAAPYATLMGKPVIPTEAAQTIGDKGDIILTDLRQYMTATKTAGIRQDVSMHLFFDYDMMAFRFIMRVGGQPWWTSTIAPKNGSLTRSWAVALQAR